ncbi:MAG: Holliday junction branch migration protein RuvA [Parcubacteria group bacterium CG10_big_fil_rev_8_21_14_0_10_38_31]|nr:MAG: Holliday junction branch migration protein RuvA [Parcubacteria group bacterium CG10_big_fil_rev_8_21_14_0_10_38_31]
MITHLTGKIILKGDKFAVLDVNGVGYHVYATFDTLRRLPKDDDGNLSFWTHLYVRENIMELYGFATHSELKFFEMLIGISGIGPKGAMGVLAVAPIDTLRQAIASGDTTYLTKVSGIGKKIADKIVLELKDKLGGSDYSPVGGMLKDDQDVIEALQSLGYSLNESREALKKIPDDITGTNNRIKEVLKNLGTNK